MGLNPYVQMAFGCAPLYIRLAAFLSAVNPSISWWQSVSQRHLRTADKSSASAATRRRGIADIATGHFRRIMLLLPASRIRLWNCVRVSFASVHGSRTSAIRQRPQCTSPASSPCRYLDGGNSSSSEAAGFRLAVGWLSLTRGSSASPDDAVTVAPAHRHPRRRSRIHFGTSAVTCREPHLPIRVLFHRSHPGL